MSDYVDLKELLKRYEKFGIFEIEETIGVWEFHIQDCPIDLKIKVVKIEPQGKFMGIANYGIKGPGQKDYYRSFLPCDGVQMALEVALQGFLKFWSPENADKTSFKLYEDW